MRCAVSPPLAGVGVALLAGLSACVGRAGPAHLKGDGLVPIASVTPKQVTRAARPRKVALLIGVDHFRDPYWPSLRWAVKDAHDLGAALRDPKVGDFDDVEILATEKDATRADVLAAVHHLAALAPGANDTVVVYISSHGTLAPTPQGGLERTLILSDTRHDDLLDTGLPVPVLEKVFDALPARRKALILASCDSGTGQLLTPAAQKLVRGLKGPLPTLESVSHASLILSASSFDQPAREDDRLENDVYTHFFVQALLDGADANGDGAVSATEAHDYARRHTYAYTHGRQVPTVEAAVVGADPILLAGKIKRPGLPVLYSYAAGLAGFTVKSGGRSKGALPGNVVLDPGPQDISIVRGGHTAFTGEVDLTPGERLPVQDLVDGAKPRWTVSVRYGGFALLDGAIARSVAGPVSGPGLSLRLRDAPWHGLDPVVDVATAAGTQVVRVGHLTVPQTVTAIRFGVGAAVAHAFGPLRLYGGPHLAFLSLTRDLRPSGLDQVQSFATLMPGLVAGAALDEGRFELGLEGQIHYLPLVVNGQVESVATGSLTAGVGLRF